MRRLRPAGADDGSEGMLRGHRGHREAAAKPQLARSCWPRSTTSRRPAARSRTIIGAGHHPRGPRDDGQARRRARSSSSCTPATRSTPRRSCCANPTARRKKSPRSRAHRSRAARERRHADARLEGRGRAAALLVRPQGGVPRGRPADRPTTTAWTARSAQAQLAEVLRGIAKLSEEFGLALPERVPCGRRQPASAHPVRRRTSRRSWSAPEVRLRASSSSAWRPAAPSPASTASASRRSTRCACSSARRARDLPRRQGRVRPARPAEPGQGRPDAASLRRARRDARPARQGSLPRPGALLSITDSDETPRAQRPMIDQFTDTIRAASAAAPHRAPHPRRRHEGLLRRRPRRRCARHTRPSRHRRLRPVRTRDDGPHRHAARRGRDGTRRAWPDARLRAAALLGTARSAAPSARTSGPRRAYAAGAARDFVLGRARARRAGRDLLVRRAGDEERRRLRCLALRRRIVRHAGR
jgi:hypothetical protein